MKLQKVKQTLQCYKELRDIIAILGLDELSEEDNLTVAQVRKYEHIELYSGKQKSKQPTII